MGLGPVLAHVKRAQDFSLSVSTQAANMASCVCRPVFEPQPDFSLSVLIGGFRVNPSRNSDSMDAVHCKHRSRCVAKASCISLQGPAVLLS